jgi:HAD superfamily hydrolase (TIGR01509 family)
MMKALIFDCDGVLVDTERDGHRVAFNRAFKARRVGIEWGVEQYGELLKVAGGQERMRRYFDTHFWPAGVRDKDAFIKDLHYLKTDFFAQIIESGELRLRSGIRRIVDEAIAENIALAVCSTSNERAVNLIVERQLGPDRKRHCTILAGDIVKKKKPDPEIYNLARERLGFHAAECLVVEDSSNGIMAAKAAGMRCVITTSVYTKNEIFTGADAVFAEFSDPPDACVTLVELKRICR